MSPAEQRSPGRHSAGGERGGVEGGVAGGGSATSPIELVGVSKFYGDVVGVDDIDLRVGLGEVFGFIGPNGAGKTTTIRLMLDLIRPTAGRVELFGSPASTVARERIGYLPAELALIDELDVRSFLEWMISVRRCGDMTPALELAERLDLDVNRRIGELSSGNRRKVGLVQALMHDPDLVVLDEPTSGLDPIAQLEFRRLIRELAARGVSIFLSSHALHEVEDVCDRVGTIVDGRLRDVVNVNDLRDRQRRHVRVLVDADRSPPSPDGLSGVQHVEIESKAGGRWLIAFDVVGPMEAVGAWIGGLHVLDLRSEPISLERRFVDEVGAGATPSTAGETGRR